MLSFRFVSYKDVLSDGGRCFKGVHLSQVHQQSYQVPNKTVKCTYFLSVVNIPAWMVQFLLWQAAKPSGDNCTP